MAKIQSELDEFRKIVGGLHNSNIVLHNENKELKELLASIVPDLDGSPNSLERPEFSFSKKHSLFLKAHLVRAGVAGRSVEYSPPFAHRNKTAL